MKKQTLITSVIGLALATSAFAQDFCSTTTHSGTSTKTNGKQNGEEYQTISKIGDFNYELWYRGGNGASSATFYSDGSMKCSAVNSDDYLCRSGMSFNSDKLYTQLDHMYADFKVSLSGQKNIGYSFIGIYGWSEDPMIEYYIVDTWASQYKPGGTGWGWTKKGDYTVDGAAYEAWTHTQVDQWALHGKATFEQFYGVRKTGRSCGTIDITAHFAEWEKLGMKLGKMYEAKVLGEVGNGSGVASCEFDFPVARVYTGSATPTNPTSSSSAKPTSSSSVNAARTPYSSNALPGTLEFENFDKGSNTYSVGGEPADYCSARSDAPEVCIIGTGASDGLGGLEPGDWFEYTIVVDKHASYSFEVLACSGAETDRTLTLSIDGKTVGEATLTAVADDWETFSKSTGKTIELAPGTHVLRVETDGYVNLDNIKFEVAELSAISAQRLQVVAKSSLQVFDAMGKFLGKVDMKDGAALDAALKANFHKSGIYLVKQGNFVQRVNVK